jgi:hypothetical protein
MTLSTRYLHLSMIPKKQITEEKPRELEGMVFIAAKAHEIISQKLAQI